MPHATAAPAPPPPHPAGLPEGAPPPRPPAAIPAHAPPPSIGLNLRVTGYCNQGGRKYMEDVFSVAYQQTEDEKDLEYAFFGIFDGHGGREAAVFAKEHLMDFIVRSKNFWVDDDESVLRAIHEGFVQTHHAMWKELEKWPKTASGLPSTAGTTASIAFIRRGKIYVGHVGDSAIVLGVQDPNNPDHWLCQPLTRDHKPESLEESKRIHESGGKVVCKSGVPRVVWNRPRVGHKGPVRRSTHIDEIPFLAVARSLGDLWSYNSEEDVFVVSPEPDTFVYPIDISKHRCLILGTDGAWNMLTAHQSVRIVCEAEKSNEQHMLNPSSNRQWINPSKRLVDKAIEKWNGNNLRADNTSVVTVMLDPPGPPRAQVLKRQRELAQQLNGNVGRDFVPSVATNRVFNADRGSVALVTNTTPEEPEPLAQRPTSSHFEGDGASSTVQYHQPESTQDLRKTKSVKPGVKNPGISIISRFPNSKNVDEAQGHNLAEKVKSKRHIQAATTSTSKVLHDFQLGDRGRRSNYLPETEQGSCRSQMALRLAPSSTSAVVDSTSNRGFSSRTEDSDFSSQDIQCNVITSSSDDEDNSKVTPKRRRKGILKESSRLSRELSALQLDSPLLQQPKRRTRSAEGQSDTENEEQEMNRPRDRLLRSSKKAPPVTDMELHCQHLQASMRNMERKVSRKTEQLNSEVKSIKCTLAEANKPHFLRSSQSPVAIISASLLTPIPAARSLRPRTPADPAASTATPPPSSRKRKVSQSSSVAAKSPKQSPSVVQLTRPVVTRARTARVLQLKK